MENEEDIYYVYNEDEDPVDSPLNYAVADEDDQQDDDLTEEKTSPLKLMFNVLFTPVQGWKKARREKITVENLQSGCFYPLLAVLALSRFTDFFYSTRATLSNTVTEAVVDFVSYFFGYFSAVIFLKIFLKKPVGEYFETNFGKVYIMLSMSTLVLFSIFTNLLPMLWPILIFLPLWTIYLMYRGVRFFKLSENILLKFTILTCASVIGFPLIIEWLLNTILPA